MKIVIEIPDKVYTYIQREWEEYDFDSVLNHLINGIKNGTPLPEHHGRLIDADELLDTNIDTFSQQTELKIKFAPTIIEADRRE